MPPDGAPPEDEPVVRPRLVRALKNRPKLVGGRVREEFLENVEEALTERRKPDTVADRVASEAMRPVQDAGSRVVKKEARDKLVKGNQGPLRRL